MKLIPGKLDYMYNHVVWRVIKSSLWMNSTDFVEKEMVYIPMTWQKYNLMNRLMPNQEKKRQIVKYFTIKINNIWTCGMI